MRISRVIVLPLRADGRQETAENSKLNWSEGLLTGQISVPIYIYSYI